MKTGFYIFLFCIFGSVVMAGVDTDITPENQVILANGTWTPTPEQTQKALIAVNKYLKNPKGMNEWQQNEIKKILAKSSRYRVQFTGIRKGRRFRKVIRCNFFPGGRGDNSFPYWKDKEVFILDGGTWYWRIEYDVEKKECINFISNGYA